MDYEKLWNQLYLELAKAGGTYIKASLIVQMMREMEKEDPEYEKELKKEQEELAGLEEEY